MINYRGHKIDLDPTKVYVVLMRYGWKKKGAAKFTAPLVRIFTGFKKFNHCGLLFATQDGRWQFVESNEKGCHSSPAELKKLGLDRKGSTIELREYSGHLTRSEVMYNARLQVGKKYDYANLLLHQPIYRITGWWIGPRHDKAKGTVQCFEFLYNCFGLHRAWLASGAEFSRLFAFKKVVFTEL